MAMETKLLTYPSPVQVEIKASWPRPHLEIHTMTPTLPQMCCAHKLKLHWNHSWTSSSFPDRVSLVLKGKNKKLFYSELRLKLKDIFIAFGKDFKWTSFQKECVTKQMLEVEPSSRGVTTVMVWFYHWSWVALPGDVVISLQARNTTTSQASDGRRAGPTWRFWSNSEAFW